MINFPCNVFLVLEFCLHLVEENPAPTWYLHLSLVLYLLNGRLVFFPLLFSELRMKDFFFYFECEKYMSVFKCFQLLVG